MVNRGQTGQTSEAIGLKDSDGLASNQGPCDLLPENSRCPRGKGFVTEGGQSSNRSFLSLHI